jgi:Ca2+-binding RTX toxin-like protein
MPSFTPAADDPVADDAPTVMAVEGFSTVGLGELPFWFLQDHTLHGTGLSKAWALALGQTTTIGLLDTGVNFQHSDFLPGQISGLTAGSSQSTLDPHGTRVAGVFSGRLDNAIGGMGGATGALVVSETVSFSNLPGVSVLANALTRQTVADVSNNSWGWRTAFTDNFLKAAYAPIHQALLDGTEYGRGGFGTVWVFAGGNGRLMRNGENIGDDSNFHNLSNARQTIAVGASDSQGRIAAFSSPGTNLLVVAPGQGIATTDGLTTGADGRTHVSGTSFAAPLVTSTVALMLEVNPTLGYRDVQQILALTARQLDAAPGTPNKAGFVNGGGLSHSRDAGFGLIDAEAAVRLAAHYNAGATAANEVALSGNLLAGDRIDEGQKVSLVLALPEPANGLRIEWIELHLALTDPGLRNLSIALISPGGTKSLIAPNLRAIGSTTVLDFKFTSAASWGEAAEGQWILELTNPGGVGGMTIHKAELGLFGAQPGLPEHWFTDAWTTLAKNDLTRRKILQDGDEPGRLNFAATSHKVVVDLGSALGHAGNTPFELVGSFNSVIGGASHDRILGSAANDTLRGSSGNDTLIGGPGADLLQGGSGLDEASYENATSAVHADLALGGLSGEATGDIFDSIENLRGSAFRDTLKGDDQDNSLNGMAGHDRLYGGAGNDTLRGSSGNDTLIGGPGADLLQGGSGRDEASYENATSGVHADLALGGVSGEATGDVFDNIENLRGSAFRDTLVGDDQDNSLNGMAGNDLLLGGAGNDTLRGSSGNDTLIGGPGADQLQGGSGRDEASYENATSAVYADLVLGGLLGEATGDIFDSIENLRGSAFRDTLKGDDQDNSLNGMAGNDLLLGGAGNDTLRGSSGNDTLIGGPGSDLLQGGSGADHFVFSDGFGNDTISGFEPDRDVLDFRSHLTLRAVADLTFAIHPEGVLIDGGAGQTILILALTTPPEDLIFMF